LAPGAKIIIFYMCGATTRNRLSILISMVAFMVDDGHATCLRNFWTWLMYAPINAFESRHGDIRDPPISP
jgi:hypothetical protein